MKTKKALICGVSGQDGAYLSRLLLSKGYEVWGTSRDAQLSKFNNLVSLGIRSDIRTISMVPNDFKSVLQALKNCNPDEIYNLSGQSSVGLSFDQPSETIESIANGTLNLLEAIRFLGKDVRFYNAGSGECFGDIGECAANENTPFKPCSPYAVAKSAAYWLVENYRTAYKLYACTGILFNHESPFRPDRFVTKKIIQSVVEISRGSTEKLILGNLAIFRDWGSSEEYVVAMWKMLQLEEPTDFVIATGQTNSLESFVKTAFEEFNLNWQNHVVQDKLLYRPNEIVNSKGNPEKALRLLDWQATTKMNGLIKKMIEFEHNTSHQNIKRIK